MTVIVIDSVLCCYKSYQNLPLMLLLLLALCLWWRPPWFWRGAGGHVRARRWLGRVAAAIELACLPVRPSASRAAGARPPWVGWCAQSEVQSVLDGLCGLLHGRPPGDGLPLRPPVS